MTHHFSINANYTLSWSRGWAAGTSSTSGFRNYPMIQSTRGIRSTLLTHHRTNGTHITFSGIWELPWASGVADSPFGNCAPVYLTSSYDVLSRGTGYFSRRDRADQTTQTNYTAFNVASGNTKQEGIPPGMPRRWPVP